MVREPWEVERSLARLCFWSGGGAAEVRVLPTILDRAREHFDEKAALSYDAWCLLYLARHGRIRTAYDTPFEAMTLREVEGWVHELSEMIKAEMKPAKK